MSTKRQIDPMEPNGVGGVKLKIAGDDLTTEQRQELEREWQTNNIGKFYIYGERLWFGLRITALVIGSAVALELPPVEITRQELFDNLFRSGINHFYYNAWLGTDKSTTWFFPARYFAYREIIETMVKQANAIELMRKTDSE